MQDKLMIESAEITRLLGTVGSPLIVIAELIKNSVDAEAKKIEVSYNRDKNIIQVSDDGIGISSEEIKNLTRPGFSSKKRNDNIRNGDGFFFTGNKGLGILSCFSICEEIIIDTYAGEVGKCHAVLNKNGFLNYEMIDTIDTNTGSVITLRGIRPTDMEYLNTETELQKLRHLSSYLYKKDLIPFPDILLRVDDNEPSLILFETDFSNMLYDVSFEYDKSTGVLNYSCETNSDKGINKDIIKITSFDIQSLEKVLLDNYGIEKTIRTRTNDIASYHWYTDLDNVPSFEGRLVVYFKQTAGAKLKQYGAGVNVYVNQFALYNYLSSDNDWLGLADFSQRKKLTNLRPHNVFGYVNFDEFNENEEELRISNERAEFIQDQTFTKLMYLLKGVIMYLTFNIDVAEKNPAYKVNGKNEKPSDKKASGQKSDGKTQPEDERDGSVKNQNDEDDSKSANRENKNQDNSIKERFGSTDTNQQSDNKATNMDDYRPEEGYKPKKRFTKGITFSQKDGIVLEQLKNKSNLSNKIYQLTYEITHLNIQNYYCSISGLYRALLECATRYIADRYPDKIAFSDQNLSANIVNVLNFYGNKKGMDKEVKIWREVVTKRHLIDTLNQYMHNETEVDLDFIEQTWKSMKTYIISCLTN